MPDNEWNTPEILAHLDTTPYGISFARSVLKTLKIHKEYCHQHRDYCGIGLFYKNNTIRICEVYDGYPEDTLREFQTDEEFLDWLSVQSDYTLSGVTDGIPSFFINNQRLTRKGLKAFIS